MNNKYLNFDELENFQNKQRNAGKTVGLCHGTFDLLHIGHIRHFFEAKSLCDILLVTVTPDEYVDKGPGRPLFNENLRVESIAAIGCVDYVALNNWPTAIELIRKVKPDIYIKGKDYKDLDDDLSGNIFLEKNVVESYGGVMYFTQSDKFSSSNIITKHYSNFEEEQIHFIDQLKKDFGSKYFHDLINSFAQKTVAVVGELIIDEYIYCESIGKSGKESMLVNRISGSAKFLGGVGALGKICADWISKIDIISCVGEKEEDIGFIRDNCNKNTELFYIKKSNSPTIKKTRYVNDYTKTKLIGFYDINDNFLNKADEKRFHQILSKKLETYDVVIEIDYGHGLISNEAQALIRKQSKFLATNSQINSFNSKYHDLTQYQNLDLMCINESEIYSHYRARDTPLEELIFKLKNDINCKNLIITRGSSGSVGLNEDNELIKCPSFARTVVDRIGAGDAYLAAASISLGSGVPLKVSMFFASIVAGRVVGEMGSGIAVQQHDLFKTIEAMIK